MSAMLRVYQLKVTLRNSEPPIWRRVQVRGDITLGDLHHVIQAVMGWHEAHLHEFIAKKVSYGTLYHDYGGWDEVRDEALYRLDQVAKRRGSRLVYEYDFGDSWQHDILVEETLSPEEGIQYPVCLAGERACPPEDVGGIWRYRHFLEAIRDPADPEHKDFLEWIGGSFDPEHFDLQAINEVLRRRFSTDEDMGILAAISYYDGTYQREAVEAALSRQQEITPQLIRLLADVLADPVEFVDDPEFFGHTYAVELLGHFQEARAHDVIVSLFSLPPDLPDELFGDMITEDLPAILLTTCGGSVERIKELLLDREAYDYCRGSAARALVYAVAEGVVPRQEIVTLFGSLFTGAEAASDSDFWDLLTGSVCDLYPEELMDIVTRAFDDGLISGGFVDRESFDIALERGMAYALHKAKEERKRYTPQNFHDRMSWWACFEDEAASLAPAPPAGELPQATVQSKKRKTTRKRKPPPRPPRKKRTKQQ